MSQPTGSLPDPDPTYWERKFFPAQFWSTDLWMQSDYLADSPRYDELNRQRLITKMAHNREAAVKHTPLMDSAEMHQVDSLLMALPPELRLTIYNHVADSMLGSSLIERCGGRSRFRVDWTAKTLPQERYSQDVCGLLAVCKSIKRELLPLFLKAYIVKFPCWDPGFKLQCMYWVDEVSDLFINNMDFIWFEGCYWRLSIYLGRSVVKAQEDEKATADDCHRYQKSESMPYSWDGIQFLVGVEYSRPEQMQRAASTACHRMHEQLKDMLIERGENRLGKLELVKLLHEAPLSGSEQLRFKW